MPTTIQCDVLNLTEDEITFEIDNLPTTIAAGGWQRLADFDPSRTPTSEAWMVTLRWSPASDDDTPNHRCLLLARDHGVCWVDVHARHSGDDAEQWLVVIRPVGVDATHQKLGPIQYVSSPGVLCQV